MEENSPFHIPVLLKEAIDLLINKSITNHCIVDATLGGGGYAEEICKSIGKDAMLVCIDKDENAIDYSKKILAKCKQKIIFCKGNFAELNKMLYGNKIFNISGIVLDLGLSSYQINYESGFSFMKDTPLDMRADKSQSLTASSVLNNSTQAELTDIFRNLGEIKNPARLSGIIIKNRIHTMYSTTSDLINVIKKGYDSKERVSYKFLAKIFQSLRIYVNNELDNLKKVLYAAVDLLVPGGRIVVVSYHSLEDRIVKDFFKINSPKVSKSKYGRNETSSKATLKILTKKPLVPDVEETEHNPKSRSAKLRAAERI